MANNDTHLKVAIVGAGIAGVYCAYRLKQAHPDWNIALFESSGRVGGRLLTVTPPNMPHVRCELGGMRYTNQQPLVQHLVEDELKLKTRFMDVDRPENFAYLRRQPLRLADLTDPRKLPYRLTQAEEGIKNFGPGALLSHAIEQLIPGATTSQGQQLEKLLRGFSLDGLPLSDHGFWNLLARSISAEAYRFIFDSAGYDTIGDNWNALDTILLNFRDFGKTTLYKTVLDGYDEVPRQLCQRFSNGHNIFLHHRLKSFTWNDAAQRVELTFHPHGNVKEPMYHAEHLILAMPRRSLELLDQTGIVLANDKVQDCIQSVTPVALFKMYVCYPGPWWRAAGVSRGRSVTDLPLRQCYYWGTEGEQPWADPYDANAHNSVLLATYDDSRFVRFWAGLGRPTPGAAPDFPAKADWQDYPASDLMIAEVHRQLMELHGLKYAPLPYSAVFKDWSDDPYGGGVNFWKTGVNSADVVSSMIQPVTGVPVYICGEAYSNNQGWVEGALETAAMVLKKIPQGDGKGPSAQYPVSSTQTLGTEYSAPSTQLGQPLGITGAGYCLPPTVRTNDDPIFDWLYQHGYPANQGLFVGLKDRRVLLEPGSLREPPTTVAELMITAARQALEQAKIQPAQVDVLIGWASVSEFLTPNALVLVHRELRLRPETWLIPVEGLENFSTSLWTADGLLKAGRAGTALIVSGCDWTRYVDYHTPQSFCVGDGAAAMVLCRSDRPGLFSVLDGGTAVMAEGYGSMFMQGPPVPGSLPQTWARPNYHITSRGVDAFLDFGRREPAALANRILKRNNLRGEDITLISHQASRVLMDFWKQEINPGQYIDTLAEFGNMISATVPLNFAMYQDRIVKDYVLFLNPSAELKAVAVLLKRS